MSEERPTSDLETTVSQPELDTYPVATKKAAPVQDMFEFLSSDVDLGGFVSPFEHVSLSDVLKKPNDEIRVLQGRGPNGQPVRFDDVDETVLLTPSDTVSHLLDETSIAAIDDDNTIMTAVNEPLETMASQVIVAHEEMTPAPDLTLGVPSNAYPAGDENAEKNLTPEERQKRMWQGIDQWIYDEFHEYVELI